MNPLEPATSHHSPPPPLPPISHAHTADATAIDSFHWHLARMVTAQAIEDFRDLGRHNEPTAIMFIMDAAAAVAAHEVGRSVVDIRRLNEFNTLGNRRFGGDWENEWDEVEDLKADSRARRAREALEMEWSAGGTGHVEEAPNGVQPVCLSAGLTSREGWRLTLSRELPLFQSRRTSFFGWRKISIGRRRIGRHAGFSTPPYAPLLNLGVAPPPPQVPRHQHQPLPSAARFPLPPRPAPAPAGNPTCSSSNTVLHPLGPVGEVAAITPGVSPFYQPRSNPTASRHPQVPITPSSSQVVPSGQPSQQASGG
ncbi:uncharacterized protein MKK02DRAFT_39368 [Dioszegia hungarica]|uniref:Uncharacterized protein n=1 Tax=Dioszegia hungarica TaxID=4972 RepID=A0AA38LX14_9TREE|nr:uncharacterized protein MKK02DRAFT_39368 [Dioszegia hungarica]KAI9639090.1 hypothetical protein MKK02DRAFT_39368 [Dioszegia hungarica]